MYPTFYHMLLDWFGIEIPIFKMVNTFGLMVALAFFFASYVLSLELKRKTKEGFLVTIKTKIKKGVPPSFLSFFSNGIFGFLIGYKLIFILFNMSEATRDPQAFILSRQGSWFGGILFLALFIGIRWWEFQKEKKKYPKPEDIEESILPYQHAGNITLYAAIFGILGAKLFHLFENPDQLVDFFTHFNAENFLSGLTMYGGLIIGGAAVIWYMWKSKIPVLVGMDANAPGLMLAYGIGRIGCQLAGDGDWGIDNLSPQPRWLSWLPDWTWSFTYPNNVNGVGLPIIDGTCYEGYCTQLPFPVFPTPFYETIMALIIFSILWKFRKNIKIPGVMFCLYLIFNGVERFFIELIRINEKMNLFGIEVTQAEVISVLLIVLGSVGWIILNKKYRANATG